MFPLIWQVARRGSLTAGVLAAVFGPQLVHAQGEGAAVAALPARETVVVFVRFSATETRDETLALDTIAEHMQGDTIRLMEQRVLLPSAGLRDKIVWAEGTTVRLGAQGVVWLESSGDAFLLYVQPSGGRAVRVTEVPWDPRAPELSRERLAVQVRSIAAALEDPSKATGGESAPREPGPSPAPEPEPGHDTATVAPANSPPGPAPVPIPPAAGVVASTEVARPASPPARFVLRAGYAGDTFAARIPWAHAAAVDAGVQLRDRWSLGIGFRGWAREQVTESIAEVEVRRFGVRAEAGVGGRRRGWGGGGAVTVGADAVTITASSDRDSITVPRLWKPVVGLVGRAHWTSSIGVGVVASAGLDLVPGGIKVDSVVEGESVETLRTRSARVTTMIGLRVVVPSWGRRP